MDSVPYHSLILVLIVIGLILLNGFFTALHTGVMSLSQDKLRDLEEKGSKDAEVLLRICLLYTSDAADDSPPV